MMSDNGDEKVGYGKPPRKTRFKAGQSGNPKGRPKGARNFATVLSTELNGRIVVSENGKRRTISRREAIAKQLVNRAVSGDPKALPILFNETRAYETEAPQERASAPARREDRAVMAGILERLRAADAAQKLTPEGGPPDSGEEQSSADSQPAGSEGGAR